jgi:uncharacterized membrane protein (DUF106 family)
MSSRLRENIKVQSAWFVATLFAAVGIVIVTSLIDLHRYTEMRKKIKALEKELVEHHRSQTNHVLKP